jgi:hypothetical protein
MRHIRIIEIPPGEAPERIRAAWVGVTIQLADIPEPQPSIWSTTGVLGREHGLLARFKSLFGVPVAEQPNVAYVVDVIAAIESLRAQSPSAAAWWERRTPHLLKLGKRFCFAASCCEETAHGDAA